MALSSGGGMTPSFQVGLATNLLERLYSSKNHRLSMADVQQSFAANNEVFQLSKMAQQVPNMIANEADKAAAASTQKLYEKKTNFDKAIQNLFAGDDSISLRDVRNTFGKNIDRQVFGGLSFNQVTRMQDTFEKSGDALGLKDLNMWVHAQGSHEGDLVNADGTRIAKTSTLQNVDPLTDAAVESKDAAKARSEQATASATPNNPVGPVAPKQSFKTELNKELQGEIDQTFINSEVTGHKAKGDFIQNYLVNQMGASNLQSVADTNQKISQNASQFAKDYANIGGGDTLISRVDGASYFLHRAIQDRLGNVPDQTQTANENKATGEGSTAVQTVNGQTTTSQNGGNLVNIASGENQTSTQNVVVDGNVSTPQASSETPPPVAQPEPPKETPVADSGGSVQTVNGQTTTSPDGNSVVNVASGENQVSTQNVVKDETSAPPAEAPAPTEQTAAPAENVDKSNVATGEGSTATQTVNGETTTAKGPEEQPQPSGPDGGN